MYYSKRHKQRRAKQQAQLQVKSLMRLALIMGLLYLLLALVRN